MHRALWLTDIHLNFLRPEAVSSFLEDVQSQRPDVILLGGDIGEAKNLATYLPQIAAAWPCPVYFVLGNHDFYFGSIAGVRAEMTRLCREFANLRYLTQEGVCELTPQVGLIGHDGWADGRLGDYERSDVMLNDYLLIEELARASPYEDPERRLYDKASRWPVLQALADEAADHVRRVLAAALERYPQAFFLTHVPPFREACWHDGHISDNEWLPHFTSKAVGDALVEVMRAWPQRHLTVLCGHTHSAGETAPLANLHVLTGGARYGAPAVQQVFEVA